MGMWNLVRLWATTWLKNHKIYERGQIINSKEIKKTMLVYMLREFNTRYKHGIQVISEYKAYRNTKLDTKRTQGSNHGCGSSGGGCGISCAVSAVGAESSTGIVWSSSTGGGMAWSVGAWDEVGCSGGGGGTMPRCCWIWAIMTVWWSWLCLRAWISRNIAWRVPANV